MTHPKDRHLHPQINIRIPKPLLERLRGAAAAKDITTSKAIRQAIEAWLGRK